MGLVGVRHISFSLCSCGHALTLFLLLGLEYVFFLCFLELETFLYFLFCSVNYIRMYIWDKHVETSIKVFRLIAGQDRRLPSLLPTTGHGIAD